MRYVIIFGIILSGVVLRAADPSAVLHAQRLESTIVLDGILDEADWQRAACISNFIQRELQEGQPATEKSEVRVLYNENNIYFGVLCFDTEPEKIIHNELKRDGNIRADDNVAIVLDTYRDYRSGFYFEVNPNGARGDGLLSTGDEINHDWNGVWDVVAIITDQGWSAEIVIPIKTLRFPTQDQGVWGFNIRRQIKRKEEEVLWTSWLRNDGLFQLSQAGLIDGLNQIHLRRMFEVKPFALAGQESVFGENRSYSFHSGLDVKYPITSNLVLDLTAFTDFAQVEADRTQINLTRFDIRYPEKRDFFLESSGVFNFGLSGADVFYSRRIGINEQRRQVPIFGGARLTGKTGSYRIGLSMIQTDKVNGTPMGNFSVARLRRDVLEKSYIGFIATNMVNKKGHHNQAVGADFSLNTSSFLGKNNLSISGAIVGTITDGKISSRSIARSLFIDYPNDNFENYFQYFVIPEEFNPEIGYVRRKGIHNYKGAFCWTPRPHISGIKKIELKPIEVEYQTDMHGILLSREYEMRPLGIEFNSGDQLEINIINNYEFLDEDFDIFGGVVIPVGIYSWWENEIQFEGSGRRKFQPDITWKTGGFFYGRRTQFEPDLTFKINENMALSTQFSFNTISAQQNSFTTREFSGRLSINLSTRLTTRTFIQWNNEDKQIYINFLLNFIPRIGSDIYLVFNQVWDGLYNYRVYSKTGIAKITYMMRF